jgi:hypothetical protein
MSHNNSSTPVRTTLLPEYNLFLRYVLDHYKLPHINCEIADIGDTIACQGYSIIYLSNGLVQNFSQNTIKTVLAHETSHRTLFPGTTVEQELHIAISKNEGIEKKHVPEFLNIIYDLLIDRINLLEMEWQDTYIYGLEELRPWKFSDEDISPDTIFQNLNVAMVYDYYGHSYQLGITEQNIFDLLYTDQRAFEKRLIELARIFKNWYDSSIPKSTPRGNEEQSSGLDEQETDSENKEHGNNTQNGNGKNNKKILNPSLPLERKLTKEDIEKVADKLSDIYDDLNPNKNLGKDLKQEFRKRRAKKIALPLISASQSNYQKQLKSTGTWNSNHSFQELDLIGTLNTFGILIPDITTKRISEIKTLKQSSLKNKPHVIIVADTSGSMLGVPTERMIDAIIAINAASKRKEWPVSVVEFNDNITLHITKSRDYYQNEEIMSKMEATGCGTNIHSTIKYISKLGSGNAIFILTDESNNSLIQKETYRLLSEIKNNRNDIFLYCIGQEFTNEFKKAIKPVITKAYSIPIDQTYSDLVISNIMSLC